MKTIPDLYHVSFDASLGPNLNPRLPYGSELEVPGPFPEPEIKRISFSVTITGCLLAVYPNIYRLFEEKNYPWVDFHVYRARLSTKDKIVSHDELTLKRYVHDAHITREHWLLNDVTVDHYAKVRLYNPEKLPNLVYYPFDDKSLKPLSLGPDLRKAKIQVWRDN